MPVTRIFSDEFKALKSAHPEQRVINIGSWMMHRAGCGHYAFPNSEVEFSPKYTSVDRNELFAYDPTDRGRMPKLCQTCNP